MEGLKNLKVSDNNAKKRFERAFKENTERLEDTSSWNYSTKNDDKLEDWLTRIEDGSFSVHDLPPTDRKNFFGYVAGLRDMSARRICLWKIETVFKSFKITEITQDQSSKESYDSYTRLYSWASELGLSAEKVGKLHELYTKKAECEGEDEIADFFNALENTRSGLHSFIKGLDIPPGNTSVCLLYNILATALMLQFLIRFHDYDIHVMNSEALLMALEALPFFDSNSSYVFQDLGLMTSELSAKIWKLFKLKLGDYVSVGEYAEIAGSRFCLAECLYLLYEMLIATQESTKDVFEKPPSKLKSSNLKRVQRKMLYYLWYIVQCDDGLYEQFLTGLVITNNV